MRKLRALVAAWALIGSTACGPRSTPRATPSASVEPPLDLNGRSNPSKPPGSPNEIVDELVRDNLEAELAEAPVTATWLGVHLYDDRIDDVRPERQARMATRLRNLNDRLKELDEHKLDGAHSFDRLLLQHRTDSALFTLTELKPLERNPIVYVDLAQSAVYELITDDFLPAGDRLRNINARLWKIRPLLDDARRNLRATTSDLAVRRAVDEAQSAQSFIVDSLPRALQNVPDPKALEELRSACGDASRALEDFANWLQHDLLPRAHGDYALGRDRLMEQLRRAEGIDVTPELLVSLGERELKDARRRYDQASRALTGGRPGVDVTKAVEEDHPKPEELLSAAQQTLESAIGFARAQRLLTLPEPERPKVIEMPAVLWGYAQLQMEGPLEQRPRDAFLFIEPAIDKRKLEQLRTFNRSVMVRTILHDAIGHYLQAEIDRHAPTTMQKIALSPLFIEGWAGYAEEMMLDEGYLAGDVRVQLAVTRATILRAARLVAAVRLHAFGAKPDDVLKVFTDAAGLDDYQARREVERAAVDPMVLADGLGRVAIDKLRDDWRSAHPGAPIGAFHDALLHHGSPPPVLLRRLLLPGDSASPL